MTPSPSSPQSSSDDPDAVYHGVDFSGGRDHRKKIWASTLAPGEEAQLLNDLSHRDLHEEIAASAGDGRRHCWLIDSAFGVPRELLDLHEVDPSWEAAAAWLASFEDPRGWRRACRERSRKEGRRLADRVASTPFAPANLRMFKQTWHCIVSVLAPLSRSPDVAILPFAAAGATGGARESDGAWQAARVWVGEGCPAVSLKEAGWPHRGYKGAGPGHRELRAGLLERLRSEEGVRLAASAAAAAIEDPEGDALDSLLLLPAARRFAGWDHADLIEREPLAAVEGWVYP